MNEAWICPFPKGSKVRHHIDTRESKVVVLLLAGIEQGGAAATKVPLDPNCDSVQGIADAIAALIRSIAAGSQPSDVSAVGYSLGGRIALAIAARHPDIATRLAIVSGSPGLQGLLAAGHWPAPFRVAHSCFDMI